jgi:hypothetical protein
MDTIGTSMSVFNGYRAILSAGLLFSLFGLSAESENKKQLCVLCALSAAGGESMSKDE